VNWLDKEEEELWRQHDPNQQRQGQCGMAVARMARDRCP
jgi:hypothetical protein